MGNVTKQDLVQRAAFQTAASQAKVRQVMDAFLRVVGEELQNGETIEFRCGGLLARAIQHELDHLNGILFIDRMTRTEKEDLKPELEELQAQTKEALKNKK